MITIWTDLYIARGARTVKTKSLQKNINYIPMVLKKYHVDSTQFSESSIYYTSRIDEYEEMFEEVNARLDALKEKYQPKGEKRDTMSPMIREMLVDSIERKKFRKKQLLKKLKKK